MVFVWLNTTHMHFRTHVKDGSKGCAGRWQSEFYDTMCDHDDLVGSVLDWLDDNGLGPGVLDALRAVLVGPRVDDAPRPEVLAEVREVLLGRVVLELSGSSSALRW